jgi:hypothetical protein
MGLKEPLERNNIKLEDTIALLDKGIIEGTKKENGILKNMSNH